MSGVEPDATLHALRASRTKSGSLTKDDVVKLHAEHVARFGASLARNATRTEVHGILQLQSPPPGPEAVTDAHRIASDVARRVDPIHVDAHHWLQKEHGKNLWKQADAMIDDAIGKGV